MNVPTEIPQGRFFTSARYLPEMLTYAQNFEDVVLRRGLQDIERGFYVDIGAGHPMRDSVTRWFYDQGWSGINIEPNPSFYELLSSERPRDINLHTAVDSKSGRATFHIIGNTGLSTLQNDVVELHARNGVVTTDTIEVDISTLDDLLDAHSPLPTIDFLKIDAEGSEASIVESAQFSRHRPRIILIESTGVNAYEPILRAKEYHFVWFDGLNTFYVRDEDKWRAELIARPPSLWDSIRWPPHREEIKWPAPQVDHRP